MSETAEAVTVARTSYGRLVAYLAVQWRDITKAEDALSDALVAALEHWPRTGVPEKPEAWLLQVARRKLLDNHRRERFQLPLDESGLEFGVNNRNEIEELPDRRLALMLLCAHPAIEEKTRPALMLQTVLGLSAQTIASAMLLSPANLAKRLTRAKQKIRDAGIRFEVPDSYALSERLHAVLEAVYAAYSVGSDLTMAAGDENDQLRGEALYLAELVATLVPEEAEPLGMYALLLFCEARRSAQFNTADEFVPLLQQDTRLWNESLIQRANQSLTAAIRKASSGPFQTEAAIQSAHCSRLYSGSTPWPEIALLHEALSAQSPTIAAEVGRAIAVAYARKSTAAGFEILDALPEAQIRNYQPWWLARAHIAEMANALDLAHACIARAIGLSGKTAARRFLVKELHRIQRSSVKACRKHS